MIEANSKSNKKVNQKNTTATIMNSMGSNGTYMLPPLHKQQTVPLTPNLKFSEGITQQRLEGFTLKRSNS